MFSHVAAESAKDVTPLAETADPVSASTAESFEVHFDFSQLGSKQLSLSALIEPFEMIENLPQAFEAQAVHEAEFFPAYADHFYDEHSSMMHYNDYFQA
jgi:hypothetical protein